jgi:hypothetical protein
VTGLVGRHPRLGGLVWDHLQYALGLAQLGHDVYYLEDSGPSVDPLAGGACGVAEDLRYHVAQLAKTMERFGLAERWAYRFPPTATWFGLPDAARSEVTESADLLIDVSGVLARPEQHRGRGRLVYVDTDPVVTQLELASGPPELAGRVAAYDAHFSFGERVQALPIPTPHRWRPTRQPVVLAEWRPVRAARKVFTSVPSWTSEPPLGFGNATPGREDVELERVLALPGRVAPLALEVAVGGTEHTDRERNAGYAPSREKLRRAGFRVADARHVCGDLDRYRHYVESSRGEWSVGKHGTVQGRAGCFSGRSACYLAAGRPVVMQDTGLAELFPMGDGALAFGSVDEAAEALREVEADYDRHAAAARAFADAFFDAELVLPALLEAALADD